MSIRALVVVALLVSLQLTPLLIGKTFAVVDGFTHAVFDENFGWPSWGGCQADEPSHLAKYEKYTTYEPAAVHSFHIVSFHISGPFQNTGAQQRWTFYSLTGAPSNVYDGHYGYTYYIDENAINVSGSRQIHMLEVTLYKSVDGSVLSFDGIIANLESHSFNGFVLVFVTENQLVDGNYPTVKWNFVFRGYGLNKTLSLAGLGTDVFSDSWNIPSNVNATNIHVTAAVYDADSRDLTHGWPYAVQSVCDVCNDSMAVPEFPNILAILCVVIAVSTIVLVQSRRQGVEAHRNSSDKQSN